MMTFLKQFAVATIVAATAFSASADTMWGEQRSRWLDIAEASKPELHKAVIKPLSVVKAINDTSAYQHWRYETIGNPKDMLYGKNFKEVKEITLDFGKHLTGYFTFHTKTLNRCQDAPVRIKFFFAEMPAELNTPLDPWRGGLSRAWMQDETITITQVDEYITIPRRVAFRYLKIELLGASPDFDFAIDDMYFTAVSSAGELQTELLPECPQIMRDIHDVSVETLRECMQTVFEDGPKRDHRLWSGDLYLQSLANRYSFRNFDLTKRCLYLFAGLAADDGIVISNIFEDPTPHPQYGSYCLTYCLLWNSTLLEYLKDTNDMVTANDLWPVAKRQVEDALTYVEDNGIFNQYKRGGYVWLFFDWRDGLDVNTPMQGATIFALDQTYELAKMLGKEKEVASWPALSKKMKRAAKKNLYDSKRGVFVSGNHRQVSILGQTWLIKAGVLNQKEAQKAIRTALASNTTVMPGTPYGTHYLIDAMLIAGMNDEARDYLVDYWGGMVLKGADTFWESYDPNDDFISAYGFSPVNSSCHAWSCTPVYFIHKYPGIFQKPLDFASR